MSGPLNGYDHEVVRALVDRCAEEAVPWTGDQLDYVRVWSSGFRWTDASSLDGAAFRWGGTQSQVANTVRFGRFDGNLRDHDAYATRKLLVALASASVELVTLLRDRDGVDEREPSIRAAVQNFRERFGGRIQVCVGIADLELESWLLTGFVAQTDEEKRRLRAEVERLHFDPTCNAELLTHRHDHDPKSPKRVLEVLAPRSDFVRREQCWTMTPLEVLREKGANNGLRAFLDEAAAVARAHFEA
jgi:hypothetical protein